MFGGGGNNLFSGFGSTTAKPAATSPFGTSTSLFGSSATPSTTSTFGSPFGGGFGQTAAPAASTTSGFGGFGSTQPTSTFGASTATSGFGSFGSGTSGFGGATQPTSTFGTSLGSSPFGSNTSAPFGSTASSNPFGSGTTATASTPFGMSTQTAAAPASTSFFGGGQNSLLAGANTATSSSPFGTSFGGTTMGGSSPFGSSSMTSFGATTAEKPTGTGNPPYQMTNAEQGLRLISICGMDAYKDKSPEELRVEDYRKKEQGQLNPTAQPTGFGANVSNPSPFGSSSLTTGSSPFGSSATGSSPFGQSATATTGSSPFGTSLGSTLGTTTSPFGQTATQTTPFGTTSSTATSSPFGQAAPATSTPFGSSSLTTGSSIFGNSGFGSTQQQTQQAQPSSIFGSSATTTQSPFGLGSGTSAQPSLLGQNTSQPTTNLFGNMGTPQTQQPASPFAQQTNSLFGATTTPATTSPMGGGTGLNLFGNTQNQQQQTSSTPSLFGQGSQTPTLSLTGNTGTTGSLFGNTLGSGNTATPSLFGTSSSLGSATPTLNLGGTSSLLGNTSQPSSFFGQSAQPATGTNLFGNSSIGSLGQQPAQSSFLSFNQPNNQTSSLGSLAQPQTSSLGSPFGLSLGANTLTANTAQQPAAVAVTQQPQVNLNNSIASSTPYFPVPPPPPIPELMKSLPKAPLAASASALSTKSYHTYAPRSTTKLVPKRFNASTYGGVEFDAGYASQYSQVPLQTQFPTPQFTFDRFVSKYSKSLKINTANETEESLTGSLNLGSSGLGESSTSYTSSMYPNLSEASSSSSTTSYTSPPIPKSSSTTNFGSPPKNNTSTQSLYESNNINNSQSNSNSSNNINNNQESNTSVTSPASAASSSNTNSNNSSSSTAQLKTNPHAPKLTKPSYFCRPSIEELQKMSDYELANVRDFIIERTGYGSVMFIGDVDVRDINLDDIVTIKTREISIYPDDSTKPEVGEGLNRRALVTLQQCWPLNPEGGYRRSEEDLTRYESLLKRKSKNDGIQFLEYDGDAGLWRFKVEHFSKYSAPDTLEDAPIEVESTPAATVPKPKFSATITLDEITDDYEETEQSPHRKLLKTPFNKRTLKSNNPTQRNEDMFKVENTNVSPLSSFYENSLSSPSSNKVQRRLSPPMIPIERQQQASTSRFNPMTTPHPTKSMSINFTPSVTSPLKSSIYQQTSVAPQSRIPQSLIPIQQQSNESIQVVPVAPEPVEDPFSKIVINPKILDLKVPAKDYAFKLNTKPQAMDSSQMRRSFRVGWGPNGQLVVPHKSSNQTVVLQKLPTKTSGSNLVVEFLKSHLNHSSVSTKENVDGWFNLTKVQEQLAIHTSKESNEVASRIWKLVTALWGANNQFTQLSYSEEVKRRLSLNQWLKDVVGPIVDQEIKELKKKPSNYLDTVFSHLSAKQINESTSLASTNKDFRLALMMTQAWGDSNGKDMLLAQIKQWDEEGLLANFETKRVEIIKLISGDIDLVYKNVNDWYRCFAINFWYKYTFNSPLPSIIHSYEESFQKRISTAPMPHYIPKNISQSLHGRMEYYDTCYLLLKLFGINRFDKFDNIFYPENVTTDIIDYSLSWCLFSILQALPQLNKQPDINNQPLLHCSFAAQLERLGLWQWSVYVLSHIPDKHCFLREDAMKSLISRHIYGLRPEDRKFLTNSLLVPDIWIDECYSWCLGYEHRPKDQFLYMLKSGQYSLAHNLILEDFGPNYIITAQYNNLKELLRKFQGHADVIASWNFGGAVYVEFIYISTHFRECLEDITSKSNAMNYFNNKNKLKDLATRAASLCLSISQLSQTTYYKKSATDLYRVSLSEISRRLLDYCQSAYEILSIDTNKSELLQPNDYGSFLKTLPLTENYRISQLNVITQQCQDDLLESIYAQHSV
ncbi:putative nucleoporin 98 [Heterostelium album PN500]|uniref:Putative nucleoporin 98 n=1 Tax=Heterostelium pallidum (strain ATCC 26659 / Pp 5 / PN500) TaxID=670386 RepID=D3BPQ4_HETP5|nr:putative nucleoporin 98 [Heterostelium album PN500]EFA76616.1 putative nucleoporin 98 [Heterostelium album PN500]|eukprot:XP_020428748.1 putative nucleoporin 98 [Heterostelium album PN500]